MTRTVDPALGSLRRPQSAARHHLGLRAHPRDRLGNRCRRLALILPAEKLPLTEGPSGVRCPLPLDDLVERSAMRAQFGRRHLISLRKPPSILVRIVAANRPTNRQEEVRRQSPHLGNP